MSLDKLVESNYAQLNEIDLYIWQYILHHKRNVKRFLFMNWHMNAMYHIQVYCVLPRNWG